MKTSFGLTLIGNEEMPDKASGMSQLNFYIEGVTLCRSSNKVSQNFWTSLENLSGDRLWNYPEISVKGQKILEMGVETLWGRA